MQDRLAQAANLALSLAAGRSQLSPRWEVDKTQLFSAIDGPGMASASPPAPEAPPTISVDDGAQSFPLTVDGRALECTVLGFRVNAASIALSRVDAAMSSLLRLLFYPADGAPGPRLAAVTRADDALSLIWDAECDLSSVRDDGLFNGTPISHVAIEVMMGSAAIDMTGLIASLSAPLAELDDVPLLYVSTYNTDVILVPEERLDETIAMLRSRFSPKSSGPPHPSPVAVDAAAVAAAGDSAAPSPPVPPPSVPPVSSAGAGASAVDASTSSPAAVPARASTPVWATAILEGEGGLGAYVGLTATRQPLHLCNMPKQNRDKCLYALLRALFFGNSSFCSFVETDADISLILDGPALALFEPDLLTVHGQTWTALRVYKGAVPFGESKLVSLIALALADAEVPLYYCSTAVLDFVLVESGSATRAMKCLRDDLHVEVDVEPEVDATHPMLLHP